MELRLREQVYTTRGLEMKSRSETPAAAAETAPAEAETTAAESTTE